MTTTYHPTLDPDWLNTLSKAMLLEDRCINDLAIEYTNNLQSCIEPDGRLWDGRGHYANEEQLAKFKVWVEGGC